MKFRKSFFKINRWLGFLTAIFFTVALGVYDYAAVHAAEKKVEQIAEKEMPLLIAEKGLAAAGKAGEGTLQGFLGSNGDELDKKQFQKQAAIMVYHMEDVEKLTAAEELNILLTKNKEWFVFAEKEIMNAAEEGAKGEEYAQKVEAAYAQINDIQAGYQKQIAAQKHTIQKLEQEVMSAEKSSHILIGIMSLILAAVSISGAILLFKKYLPLKGAAVFSKTAENFDVRKL
ncbi:hypothetical protein [Bacillus benzoevorans]|uniref:Chemotaxis methyl-accepting receptor HlyB-like 4HB MCP domain-containing protein n=1 Tax=Bacillus benzoevorans TaxID=1456 RepID=A0A7X0HU53_9BACI|nr:hypothetical protein [Bacillus benzoevorans]MBB6446883.1 hypothetical protein [Bacillus benzoevorans]